MLAMRDPFTLIFYSSFVSWVWIFFYLRVVLFNTIETSEVELHVLRLETMLKVSVIK
jgi:hypothetical protein